MDEKKAVEFCPLCEQPKEPMAAFQIQTHISPGPQGGARIIIDVIPEKPEIKPNANNG